MPERKHTEKKTYRKEAVKMYTHAPGIMLVVTVTALIFLYLLHRVLNRLRLGFYPSLFIVMAMFAGGDAAPIPVWRGLSINIGGMLIPLAICLYLILTADEAVEKVRGIVVAPVVGLAVWGLDRMLPLTPGSLGYEMDPLYLPATIAGTIAYILGRSRRSAFIGGIGGILVLDLAAWIENLSRGFRDIQIVPGGAGVFDAAVISGVFAVLLAELVGEIRERAASESKS